MTDKELYRELGTLTKKKDNLFNMPLFAELLHDKDDRVRMEAPEMFRVMGKRRPQIVKPYLDSLQWLAENDPNSVVRIHSAGAVRVIG